MRNKVPKEKTTLSLKSPIKAAAMEYVDGIGESLSDTVDDLLLGLLQSKGIDPFAKKAHLAAMNRLTLARA